MPMYDFECVKCQGITTRFRKIDERNQELICPCGSAMYLAILSAPFAAVQPEAHYVCPVTGKQITSWRERKNSFAEHDLIDANEFGMTTGKKARLKKKAERQEIAKTYLPPDLKDSLKKMGTGNADPQSNFQVE